MQEDDFIVLVFGKPDARDDNPIDEGPECFYPLCDGKLLRMVQAGERVDIKSIQRAAQRQHPATLKDAADSASVARK